MKKAIKRLRRQKEKYKKMSASLKIVLKERDSQILMLRDQLTFLEPLIEERTQLAIQCHELKHKLMQVQNDHAT